MTTNDEENVKILFTNGREIGLIKYFYIIIHVIHNFQQYNYLTFHIIYSRY